MIHYKIHTDNKECYYSTSRNSKMHCVKNKSKYCYVTNDKSIVISMCFYDSEKHKYTKLKTQEIKNLFEVLCDNNISMKEWNELYK